MGDTRTLLTMVVVAMGLAGASTAGWACEADQHLAYGQPIELAGVVKTKMAKHEAQGPFKVFYLQLDQGVCVDPSEDDAGTETPVDRIQIAGDALTSDLPEGSRVTAKGSLFPAHTMWHVEPVLIDATEVQAN